MYRGSSRRIVWTIDRYRFISSSGVIRVEGLTPLVAGDSPATHYLPCVMNVGAAVRELTNIETDELL